jgi:hypothetical protein
LTAMIVTRIGCASVREGFRLRSLKNAIRRFSQPAKYLASGAQ